MKKLFTLFVFLACFLGANAKEVVDAEVDFTKATEIKYYGWGRSDAAAERLSLDGENGLHYHSEEATGVNWDVQFFPIGGVSVEEGVTYKLTVRIKGTPSASIAAHFAGVDNYSAISFTEDWQDWTVDYTAKGTSGDLLVQCGSFVGDYWISYMKITHEGRDEKPVEWKNILTNGDAEGEFGEVACAQRKEFGIHSEAEPDKEWIREAEIVDDPDATSGQGKVFHTQSQIVNPVIMNSDGTAPDASNTWQNQFWIVFPRPLLAGEGYKVSFKYKASEAIRVSTQTHKTPGNYLGGGFGDVNFTTQWQTFESKELTAANSGDLQSIAFQFGEDEAYLKSIDFYFDDIKVEIMDLKEGFFAAGLDTDNPDANWNTFNFDNAVELVWDNTLEAYVGVIGTKGDQDSWVNQAMVSTKFGNDKGFKANTVKVTGRVKNDPEQWLPYSAASKATINLPAKGVWQIAVDTNDEVMNFIKLEGEADKEPVDIAVYTGELVINAVEREPTSSEQPADAEAGIDAGTGNTWDNQFFIVANRTLKKGEATVIEFKYLAQADATSSTSSQGNPGAWVGGAFGNVDFTTEEQTFTKDFEIGVDEMQSIAFDMAVIKEANVYTIKEVKWYLKDEDLNPENQTMENLINADGTGNFFVKIGAGNDILPYGGGAGITNVTSKSSKTSAAIYNIAGQRVNNDYKGLVVKEGKKFVNK